MAVFDLGPTAGGRLGASLGTGISNSLQNLAASRMQQIQQRQQRQQLSQGLQALFNPEESEKLSNLSPDLLKNIISEKSKAQQRKVSAAPGLQSLIPGLSSDDAQKISELTPGIQLEFYRNFLNTPAVQEEVATEEQNLVQPQQNIQQLPIEQQLSPEQKLKSLEKNPEIIQNIPKELSKEQRISEHKAKQAAKKETTTVPTQNKKKTPGEKLQEAKQKQLSGKKEQEIAKEERVLEHKEIQQSKKYAEELDKSHRAIREGKFRLGRMKELTEKGSLGIPLLNYGIRTITKGISGHGIDLTALLTADAQEMEKLSQDFSKNAKDYFPGKILQTEFESFMRTIPSLSQSNEGRRKVMHNIDTLWDLQELYYKAKEDIIEENNGKIPPRLESLIEKRTKKESDKLSEKFAQGIPRKDEGFLKHLGAGITNY
jgi:hypothetical protein